MRASFVMNTKRRTSGSSHETFEDIPDVLLFSCSIIFNYIMNYYTYIIYILQLYPLASDHISNIHKVLGQ